MIDYVLKVIITELGAQGLLVVGLYFVLYRPLKNMSGSLKKINHELSEIINLLKYNNRKKE